MSPKRLGVRTAVALCLVGLAPAAAQAAESRWALAPYACDGELLTRDDTPLIFADGEIRWFDQSCRVVSSYKVKDSVFLQAQCNSNGKTATIPIMLEPNGARLRLGWSREPVREMRRCRADSFGFE